MKDSLLRLEELTATVQSEAVVFATGNRSAGARMRKALLEIKELSHQMRLEISTIVNASKA